MTARRGFRVISIALVVFMVVGQAGAGTGRIGGDLTTADGVGNGPAAVMTDSSTNRLFVANQTDGTVSVFNIDPALKAPSLVKVIAVGTQPSALVRHPDGRSVYVANTGSNNVSLIDLNLNVVTTIAVGQAPSALGFESDSRPDLAGVQPRVYVANSFEDTVSVIDAITTAVVATIPIQSAEPSSIVVDTLHNYVYVGTKGGNVVTIVEKTNLVDRYISIGEEVDALAIDVTGGRVYAADTPDLQTKVIDTDTRRSINTIILANPDPTKPPIAPKLLAVDPDIDPAAGDQPMLFMLAPGAPTGDPPVAGPDGVFMIKNPGATRTDTDQATVVDADKFVPGSSIQVGLNALGMFIDATTHFGFTANFGSNSVSIFGLDLDLPKGLTLTPPMAPLVGVDISSVAGGAPGPLPELQLNQVLGTATDATTGIAHVTYELHNITPAPAPLDDLGKLLQRDMGVRQAKVICLDAPINRTCAWTGMVPLLLPGLYTLHVTIYDRGNNAFSPEDVDVIVV